MYMVHLLYLPFTASPGNGYPTGTHWDNMMTNLKHSQHTVPERFEHNGHPPSGAAINLRGILKPHSENAYK